MNKYATLAVLAIAAFALASSQPTNEIPEERETKAALRTNNDEETAYVREKNLEVFADFCVQARDDVFADLERKAGSTSSKGFSWFFSTAGDVAKEVLNTNRDATDRLSNQLANPQAEVEGNDVVADAQRDVATQSQPKALMTAFQGALSATAEAIVNVVSQKVAAAKEFADPSTFTRFASQACEQVKEYEDLTRAKFEEYKQSLPEQAQEQYGEVRFDEVPCVTASRISRANNICHFVKVGYAPLKKVMRIA